MYLNKSALRYYMPSKRQAARTDLRQNDLELSVDRATRRPVAAAHATLVSLFRRAEILITTHALQDRVLNNVVRADATCACIIL